MGCPCDEHCPVVDMAGYKNLPIGSEDFAQVMQRSVFVDKSLLIRDVIDSNYSVVLFCRPRRFGKSLAMRMLQCFFEAPVENWYIRDRGSLFERLAIRNAGDRYYAERGCHPVIFLSLGSVYGATWDEARALFAEVVAGEYNRHYYLVESGAVRGAEREVYERLCRSAASQSELAGSLAGLSGYLSRFHGAGTVILIDEYDRLVTAGYLGGYLDETVSFMRSWLTGALKASDSLYKACLTGVQRVSKESIFSGLNNIVVSTPLDGRFTEGFGFTAREAETLAAYLGHADALGEMRDWYDGYNFGGVDVYNPWSLLNYFDQKGLAQPYWGNTSDNAIVHDLFAHAGDSELDSLRELVQGGTVRRSLDLQTSFSELDQPSSMWSQLYLSGYLTTDDVTLPNDETRLRELRIPNREVAWLFRREFFERAQAAAGGPDQLHALHAALVATDEAALERVLGDILKNAPSHYDLTSENSYHMFLLGLLYVMPGYGFPLSNREVGFGRPDIVLEPERASGSKLPALVIELKFDRAAERPRLAALAQEALAQARENEYGHGLWGAGTLVWGIAFSGKRAVCSCVRVNGR